MGNTLEAYDFCLYGFLSGVFAKIFFPPHFTQSLTVVFLLFFIAYVTRQIGALFWGHIADKYGRKPVLLWTVTIMAIPAIGIACIPTYDSIGFLAIIIVLILRMIQGFAFGGEFPTVLVTLYEISPNKKRAFFCSLADTFTSVGKLVGVVLIALFSYLLAQEDFIMWGWRILFGVSIIFIVIFGYIRMKMIETISIEAKQDKKNIPLQTALKEWKNIVKIFLCLFCPCALFFSYTFHIKTIFENNFSIQTASFIHVFMMVYFTILLPLVAAFGDKVGRIKFARILLFLLIIFIYPIYIGLLSTNVTLILLSIILLGFLSASVLGVSISIAIGLTNKNCRVSMTGIGHGMAVLVFGATAPMIHEMLTYSFQSEIAPSYYLMISAVISLMTMNIINKSRKT